MSATIIPCDIYDEAVVVDRFISLSTQLERGIDAGLAAHNKAEADQGYPPASLQDFSGALAYIVLVRFGHRGVAELNRQTRFLIRDGFGLEGDSMPDEF